MLQALSAPAAATVDGFGDNLVYSKVDAAAAALAKAAGGTLLLIAMHCFLLGSCC